MDKTKSPRMALGDDAVALVPMRNLVLLPHLLMPTTVGRPTSPAAIVQHKVTEDGQIHAGCQGLQRIRSLAPIDGHGFLAACIERLDEPGAGASESHALA